MSFAIHCSKQIPTETSNAFVANLENPIADVKIRRAKEFIWNKGQMHAELANYDAVKTGSASMSDIFYKDSTQINVHENTMVIILERHETPHTTQTEVALNIGHLQGRLNQDPSVSQTLIIKTARGWIRASNRTTDGKKSSVMFRASILENRTLEIKANTGRIQLLAQGKEREIPEKSTLTIPPNPNDLQSKPTSLNELSEKSEYYETLPKISDQTWNSTRIEPDNVPKQEIVFEILNPQNKATIYSERVLISGVVSSGTKVFLKNKLIAQNKDGKFSVEVLLQRGLNIITFQTESASGIHYKTLELLRK